MALVQASSANGALVELEDMGNSVQSLGRMLDSQKELFHSQIDQLQKLVVAQCKLTGVNPLSQEMAAGALSIKIGKRPRDLLNPKAIKYMQSLFSIKDTIGKKETREISALCGITVTQVRDYFAGQRSRVRKLVRLSREKLTRSDASKETSDVFSFSPDQSLLVSNEAPVNAVDHRIVGECTQVPENSGIITAICTQVPGNSGHVTTVCTQVPGNSGNVTASCTLVPGNSGSVCTQVPGHYGNVTTVCTQVPWNSENVATVQDGQQDPVKTDLKTVEEGPSCSLQEENIPGVDSDDKKFLENIFILMRKEQTFSGQVKLMEWVLQIHNSAVLNWFSTKGGITILATWLSQAALEEQTTVLLVIFKVLCHLPLHKALPVQMSAILQTVNRLRFYRTSDISNRARILLSRWSKMFIRSQALKHPSFMNSPKNVQKAIIRKQRISEILSDESWQSKIDIPEEILALAESTDDSRKSEPRRALKLLPESSVGSTKKHGRSVSSPKIKERRKVLLVEQPDRKMAGRNVQVARAMPMNHSRPMSADDIQKAKMRAIFMQHKYGKTDASASENNSQKTEDHKVPPASQANNILPPNRIPQLRQLRRDEIRKPSVPTAKISPHNMETSINPKVNSTSQEQLWEKLKRDQLQWGMPPEMRINTLWRVGAGENSKEVEVQTQRTRREKETFYSNLQDIPPNPKEPWDTEMDYDDSLTPEIPAEQPPDLDSPAATVEGSLCFLRDSRGSAEDSPVTTSAVAASPPTTSSGFPEPDLELLAVLLKNPDLVFALTSSQGKSLTNDQTVALLDMLKKSGLGLTEIVNGMVNNSIERPKEPEPNSLPSPTPSDATRTGWRSELPSNSNTPLFQPQMSGSRGATIVPTVDSQTPSPAAIPMAVNNQAQSLNIAPQAPTTILSLPQLTVTVNPTSQLHQPVLNSLGTKPPSMYPMQQSPTPEAILSSNHYQVNNPSMPTLLPTQLRPQPLLLSAEPPTFQHKLTVWPPAAIPTTSAASVGRRDPMLDSWNGGRNGVLEVPAANSHFLPNPNNYNSNNNMYPRRNVMLNRSEMETWSPEHSPGRSPEFQSGHNFPEPRREFGRSQRPDWSRQWSSEHRDRYRSGGGGRRRRDRDRRR